MKVQYKRIHLPSGKEEICDFNNHQLLPHFGVSKNGKPIWVNEAEKLIQTWNRMAERQDGQVWGYELVITH